MGNNTRAGAVNPIPICLFQQFSRTLHSQAIRDPRWCRKPFIPNLQPIMALSSAKTIKPTASSSSLPPHRPRHQFRLGRSCAYKRRRGGQMGATGKFLVLGEGGPTRGWTMRCLRLGVGQCPWCEVYTQVHQWAWGKEAISRRQYSKNFRVQYLRWWR